jgi:outer membrane protein assembly factor BamA
LARLVAKYYTGILAALINSLLLSAQNDFPAEESLSPGNETSLQTTSSPFVIGTIYLAGNKKTKPEVILRELPFKEGEHFQLQVLVSKFEQAREQLMNTALFHEASVTLKSFKGYTVDILITVKERWYLFPVPYIKPVYRNVNEWLDGNKRNFNNLNYGLKLMYNNTTGRNDKLNAWLVDGYSHHAAMSYDRMYIDKKLQWGLSAGFSFGKTREVNYNTSGDKQLLLRDNNSFLKDFTNIKVELTYRKAIKTRHRFGVGYISERVKDTVIALNPFYFSSNRPKVSYLEFYYVMNYFDLDYIPYPTRGYATEIYLGKKGLNNIINVWQVSVKGSANWHLSPKNFLNLRSYTIIKLPFNQPYYSKRILGYGDEVMQGYQNYVIDGVAGGYLKAALTREIFSFRTGYYRKKRNEHIAVPFRIFAKVFTNAGYVYNPSPGANSLNNRMLYSGGFGIDILTIYDFTLKLEYSFNQLGQNGVFLQRNSYF